MTWRRSAGIDDQGDGPRVAADFEIGDTDIRGTVKIPVMLSMMAGPIVECVKTSAQKMLSKPAC